MSASSAALLSRQELARRLGRSLRWVDARVREGMPSEPPTDEFPHRRFRLAEVEAWLERRGASRPADGFDGGEGFDLQELASALARTFTAARGEDRVALVDALRALAGAADRLTEALERTPG